MTRSLFGGFRHPLAFLLITGGLLTGGASTSHASDSFQVDLLGDGETIGDMRPVFLKFETRPMPAISPREVARRYQRLFDVSDDPEVRVDALNRLANIRAVAGDDAGFSDQQEQRVYREVLDSYEAILQRGSYAGKLDELLYQMAKAHAFVGQAEESTTRLRQLVGLYPDSPLVAEARFRIAESAYSAGDYAGAELGYRQVIDSGAAPALTDKARYMLAWSQYQQGPAAYQRAAGSFLEVLGRYYQHTARFREVPAGALDVINDALRMVALMADRSGGSPALAGWLADAPAGGFAGMVYDRLADYYAGTGRYRESARVIMEFVGLAPAEVDVAAFRAQLVEVWGLAGKAQEQRGAKADFVTAYQDEASYAALTDRDQRRWQGYSRELAAIHYQQGQSGQQEAFAQAARYYRGLADRLADNGEELRLAGDAWLQGGAFVKALQAYRDAAYGSGSYSHAADAGWAAVVLQRQGLDGEVALSADLASVAAETDRFAAAFPEDHRLPGLLADMANRSLAGGLSDQARRYATAVVRHPSTSNEESLSGWLVLAQANQAAARYAEAEQGWRKALALVAGSGIGTGTGTQSTFRAAGGEQAPATEGGIRQRLADTIYRQGEVAAIAGDVDLAVANFQRIEPVLPESDTAIRGRYDAANTLLGAQRWQSAITELRRFRQDYGQHPLAAGISDKLVLAYQSSGQPLRAADELVEVAGRDSDPWPRRLQAAELYHEGGDSQRRNGLYAGYLAVAGVPQSAGEHLQQQQMRQRLLESGVDAPVHRDQLVAVELASAWHSAESLAWAAAATIELGNAARQDFEAITISAPLAQSLARKQAAMQAALSRYQQVARLDDGQWLSQSLYRQAELYRTLAQDLMASERPVGLNELELEQYDLLLEEEAFPFEETAIDLHARNHRQLAEGRFDPWIARSLARLEVLFPGRYARDLQWLPWQPQTSGAAPDHPTEGASTATGARQQGGQSDV
ncbi:hypothetical protein [Marinobacter sp.]|uniref:hypothetical protein n=1 Tax=Marinobacter sp. TaxID=50741 RepID=UPI001992EE8F|nr:hypothetical protein [Marinobacter sp.]MBD3656181.1 hypothetical protein [Marinobacter sp.]